MKKITFYLSLAMLSATVACSPSNKSNDSENKENKHTQDEFVMPKVQYPAAIVFEGGDGNPWFDEELKNHTPTWRLYLCLEKTGKPISNNFELDFTALGNPIEMSWTSSDTKELLNTERLTRVLLKYTYTTKLTDKPEENFGYAYGEANVTLESSQRWDVIYDNKDIEHSGLETRSELFDAQEDRGSLVSYQQHLYSVDKKQRYITRYLERFAFSQKDHTSHVIEPCEQAKKSIVLLRGDELKDLKD